VPVQEEQTYRSPSHKQNHAKLPPWQLLLSWIKRTWRTTSLSGLVRDNVGQLLLCLAMVGWAIFKARKPTRRIVGNTRAINSM
jgi:hypothetical protein